MGCVCARGSNRRLAWRKWLGFDRLERIHVKVLLWHDPRHMRPIEPIGKKKWLIAVLSQKPNHLTRADPVRHGAVRRGRLIVADRGPEQHSAIALAMPRQLRREVGDVWLLLWMIDPLRIVDIVPRLWVIQAIAADVSRHV